MKIFRRLFVWWKTGNHSSRFWKLRIASLNSFNFYSTEYSLTKVLSFICLNLVHRRHVRIFEDVQTYILFLQYNPEVLQAEIWNNVKKGYA